MYQWLRALFTGATLAIPHFSSLTSQSPVGLLSRRHSNGPNQFESNTICPASLLGSSLHLNILVMSGGMRLTVLVTWTNMAEGSMRT